MQQLRCVNLDWLELYCLESRTHYPCNADYFRQQGYFVRERDYGTRQYNQMFTLEDEKGEPWIEIRRDPAAGDSDFSGLVPESTHIRLVNRACYDNDCIQKLRAFLIKHDYIFQRIYRIDVCYDFEKFDTGDMPAKFARRYIEGIYRKVNQCHLNVHGEDRWNDFEWECLSWGNPKSMVSTKMYNKTKELSRPKADKPYIRYAWFLSGLISNPVTGIKVDEQGREYKPEIWRVEFSMKSSARNWILIEDQSGKKVKKKAIPHNLSLFDTREKLWDRFEELAYHYFKFRYKEYKNDAKKLVSAALECCEPPHEKELKRKDLCREKILFYFNKNREFLKLDQLPKASKPCHDDEVLRRHLQKYRMYHVDTRIREACDILLSSLSRSEITRLVEDISSEEIERLQRVLSLKMHYPEKDILEIIGEVKELMADKTIF